MGKLKDLTGQQFGRLTVLKRAENSGGHKQHVKWTCECDCGNIKDIVGSNLTRGLTNSCGCLQKEKSSVIIKDVQAKQRLKYGESAKNKAFYSYKRNAVTRGIAFEIDINEFLNISQQNCYYCGGSHSNVTETKGGVFKHNGLDRVNNSIGYVSGNIVPCCKHCNVAKRSMTFEEFFDWSHRLSNHIKLIHDEAIKRFGVVRK